MNAFDWCDAQDQAEIASELGIERKAVASLLDLAGCWSNRLKS